MTADGNEATEDRTDAGGVSGRRYELVGPRTGRIVRQPAPSPGIGQVIVRVHANGVCASDLPTWSARQPRYPVALGHEPVGEVVAVGPGVDLVQGTLVTGRLVQSYADFVLADIRDVVEVPGGVPVEQALGEPLGCVVEALRRTPIHLPDRIGVIGGGFMGLCLIQLLARSATARLTAVDLREDARLAALGIGADDVHHPGELPERLHCGDGGPGRGLDVVFEATGTQSGLDLATCMVRPHGVISIIGFHQGARQVDMHAWNWKAVDVVNAHVRDPDRLTRSIRAGLDLIAAKRIDLGPLLTHRFPFDRIDDAFEALITKPRGFIKAIVLNG